MANEWKPGQSREKSSLFPHSSPKGVYCSPQQMPPTTAVLCCCLAIEVTSTRCVTLPLLSYCRRMAASSPRRFSAELSVKVMALAKLCPVSSDGLKKISHVSSSPAALLGFLFAIKLFLILTVFLLFARKIIILSQHQSVSLLSPVVSDGLNKYPLHKAHQAGQKGISPLPADPKFRRRLPVGEKGRLGGLRRAAVAAVLIVHTQSTFIHLGGALRERVGEVKRHRGTLARLTSAEQGPQMTVAQVFGRREARNCLSGPVGPSAPSSPVKPY